ncbi:MAG: DUF1801 domain-containing protein [Pseudomonadota bacterium]
MTRAFEDPAVARVFAGFPDEVRAGVLELREMILDVAARTEGVGALQETLKWGQPAYLTPETKSGSTLRLGVPKGGGFALYTHCQTRLLSEFQALFPDEFAYEGNRAIHFAAGAELPLDRLELLVRNALTYHLR